MHADLDCRTCHTNGVYKIVAYHMLCANIWLFRILFFKNVSSSPSSRPMDRHGID